MSYKDLLSQYKGITSDGSEPYSDGLSAYSPTPTALNMATPQTADWMKSYQPPSDSGGWDSGFFSNLSGGSNGLNQGSGGIKDYLRSTGFLGSTDDKGLHTDGWGGLALGGIQGLLGGFMAMKQYGVARDSLNASKEEFAKNFASQSKLTNSNLEDRQRARVASNPGAYQSVSDYMSKNGV